MATRETPTLKTLWTGIDTTQPASEIRAMITLISGTNRPGSNSRKVAANIEAIYQELGTPLKVIDLADLPPEIFNPSSYAEKPASFQPFTDAVLESSGLIIVTPEYNGSLPGVLKYFIDMLKFPESFEHRCVAFTGHAAGIWGAFRAVEQLQMIFAYRNAHILPERVWIPRINEQWKESGASFKDPTLMPRLEAQVDSFADFVRLHRAES